MSFAAPAPALALRGIEKRFGSVRALHGADFVVSAGRVHALLGENGAGKSTLMHIAFGLERADAGTVEVAGQRVRIASPRAAQRLGIGMVHQHSTSIAALTVAENIALTAGWRVRPRELHRRVAELAERLGMGLDPTARVATLGVVLRQRLEIVKALAGDARVLLLDEPTAVLAPAGVDDLLAFARRFAAGGGAAVLITHKLHEALRAADDVTVLRRGRVVLSGLASGETAATLAAALIGDTEPTIGREAPAAGSPGAVLIDAASLVVPAETKGAPGVRGATLVVRGGEIVGVAAVEGNGQRELLRAFAGLLRQSAGRLAVATPVAFVPEDRTNEGLIGAMTLTENVALGLLDSASWASGPLLDWRAAAAATETILSQFGVRATGARAAARTLSGGNQQKLVLGRSLARAPRVLVAENPTRGLDTHATQAVHARLRAVADAGAAVVLHSSDLDEVIALADRVVVMAGGRLYAAPDRRDRAAIGALMLAGGAQ